MTEAITSPPVMPQNMLDALNRARSRLNDDHVQTILTEIIESADDTPQRSFTTRTFAASGLGNLWTRSSRMLRVPHPQRSLILQPTRPLRQPPAPPVMLPVEVKSLLDAISSFELKSLEHTGGQVVCCVCLENYKVGDECTVLPCTHRFHTECLKGWVKKRKCTCPICRTDIRGS